MRTFSVLSSFLSLASLLAVGSALQALSNSPCAVKCGNVLSSTSGSDIVCGDNDYGSSAGEVFENCINCQINSTYVDPVTKQTDLQWALYNLRYALSWCLFGYPNNPNIPSSPCTTSFACGPLQNAFDFDSLSPNASVYKYCALIPDINVPKCTGCLKNQPDESYLRNFVTVLNGACTQQPISGQIVSLEGNLFSTTPVNITNATTTENSNSTPHAGQLSLGAKVGIAVSAIVAALGVVGFCIVCHGRRRRRRALAAHQQQTGYAGWIAEQQANNPNIPPSMSGGNMSAGGFHDSPQSQRPLFPGPSWGQTTRDLDSPADAVGEKVYFSPYSSQYSSPISPNDQVHVLNREWPLDRKGSIGAFTSGLGNKSSDQRGLEVEGDRIEMQNVAPVLSHPGHRRGGALSADDVRKGHAI